MRVERGDCHNTPVLSSSTISGHGHFSLQVLQRSSASVLSLRQICSLHGHEAGLSRGYTLSTFAAAPAVAQPRDYRRLTVAIASQVGFAGLQPEQSRGNRGIRLGYPHSLWFRFAEPMQMAQQHRCGESISLNLRMRITLMIYQY